MFSCCFHFLVGGNLCLFAFGVFVLACWCFAFPHCFLILVCHPNHFLPLPPLSCRQQQINNNTLSSQHIVITTHCHHTDTTHCRQQHNHTGHSHSYVNNSHTLTITLCSSHHILSTTHFHCFSLHCSSHQTLFTSPCPLHFVITPLISLHIVNITLSTTPHYTLSTTHCHQMHRMHSVWPPCHLGWCFLLRL